MNQIHNPGAYPDTMPRDEPSPRVRQVPQPIHNRQPVVPESATEVRELSLHKFIHNWSRPIACEERAWNAERRF